MNMMTKPQSRYDILFQPVRIGLVTAANRFYQVPRASEVNDALPRVPAAPIVGVRPVYTSIAGLGV